MAGAPQTRTIQMIQLKVKRFMNVLATLHTASSFREARLRTLALNTSYTYLDRLWNAYNGTKNR